MEEHFKHKLAGYEAERQEVSALKERLEDLTAEVEQLRTQKSEKDAKLKN